MKKGLTVLLVIVLIGCSSCEQKVKVEPEEEGPIVIPAVFLINPATNLSDNQELVAAFNKEYEGQYYVEVEWLTETASGYRSKLKQWNVLDELPLIITDVGFDNDFYELLVQNNRLIDLLPYMKKSKEWMQAMQPDILEDCIEEDGTMYLAPLGNPVYSYAGFIYNKKQVGYDTFPETWEDFFRCLEQLKTKAATPLALHGLGSYWVPMLIGTAYIERTKQGRQFMEQNFPESFDDPSMVELFDIIPKLYKYTFYNAQEIDYDQAAERFLDGRAAIIANGHWMFDAIHDKDTFRFAAFPENTLMVSTRMSAWAITTGYDQEVTEGAVKFLEYRILKDREESDAFMSEESNDALDQSYIAAVEQVKTIVPNYQLKWEQKIQENFFSEYMPGLIQQQMSSKQFISKLDEVLNEIKKEK